MNLNEVREKKPKQKSMSNAISSQLAVTQNVIRNKFEKACINRLEHEKDVNQVLKPLIANPTSSSTCDDRHQQQQSTAAVKIKLNESVKSRLMRTSNPNELCARLRVLLAAANTTNVMKRIKEINAILEKLVELGIL